MRRGIAQCQRRSEVRLECAAFVSMQTLAAEYGIAVSSAMTGGEESGLIDLKSNGIQNMMP